MIGTCVCTCESCEFVRDLVYVELTLVLGGCIWRERNGDEVVFFAFWFFSFEGYIRGNRVMLSSKRPPLYLYNHSLSCPMHR